MKQSPMESLPAAEDTKAETEESMKEYRIENEAVILGTGAAELIHTNKTTGKSRHFYGIIRNIEDRGDYLYIGYVPNDFRICRFGYFRLYKDGQNRAVDWKVRMV